MAFPDTTFASRSTVITAAWAQAVNDRLVTEAFVGDYGAVGDGTTDDTSAINNAIASGAKRIVFDPTATYLIDGLQVVSLAKIVLNGRGATLKLKNTASAGQMLRLYQSTDIKVTGFEFDGNATNQSVLGLTGIKAAYITGCTRVVFEGNYIRDTAGVGLHFYECNDAAVRGNVFSGTHSSAVYAAAATQSVGKLFISGNSADNSSVSSTYTETGVINVQIAYGLGFVYSDVHITDNIVRSSLSGLTSLCTCIVTRNVVNYQIDNNHCYGSVMPISVASGSNRGQICNNTIQNITDTSTYYGIEVAGYTSGSYQTVDVLVADNNIDMTRSTVAIAGIQINGGASRITVTGNKIKASYVATGGGVRVNPNSGQVSYDLTITNNTINGGIAAGWFDYVEKLHFADNVADLASTAQFFAYFAHSTNLHIKNNTGYSTGLYGLQFYVPNAESWTVDNTRISGNEFPGIPSINPGRHIYTTSPGTWTFSRFVVDHSADGIPESNIVATIGSRWFRSDGGAGTTLYIKESGAGNTGWVGK